jgi:uncharacterized membrane protein YgcG
MEISMTELTEPITSPPVPETAPRRLSGTRRAIASVLLTVGLFAVGGTAVALAADPSATPAPSTTPGSGGTGAPSGKPSHNGQDCPNMGGSNGSSGSGGSSSSPAAPNVSASPSV